jgi:hypothetical protein
VGTEGVGILLDAGVEKVGVQMSNKLLKLAITGI